jgi:hypothetical protein
VAPACGLSAKGLAKGDLGVVALVHHQGEGFEVEFTTLAGETVAIETLLRAQVRTVRKREIAHARELVTA